MIKALKCLLGVGLQRLGRIFYSRNRFLVYARSLTAEMQPCCAADIPLEFRINDARSLAVMETRGDEYETGKSTAEIKRLLSAGEVLVSGWIAGELVYYGWIQFQKRKLARLTSLPIPSGKAFIYRCFTRPDFRGKHIYPAALDFMCCWLGAQGYGTAIIDHHAGNVASQAGILRSGLRPVAEYTVLKVLWLRWAVPDKEFRILAGGSQSGTI